jgi:3alpha(or 20beta)-hydroxysteroid dehydrogenase
MHDAIGGTLGRLDGKVALITGAARGQGAAEARLFVAEGARVAVADILDDAGKQLADELGDAALFVHHDVTREDDWERAVASVTSRFGRLDVLVNNAGVFAIAPLTTTSLDEYLRIVTINQVGTFLGMRAVAATMTEQGNGSIVNISSVAGMVGSPGSVAYTASKFAVRGMTKVAAIELAPFGIRVNSVHPGIIDTEMLHQLRTGRTDVVARMATRAPIGRPASADEVAPLVLFLASDESRYSTGSEFVVDGGLTAQF